MNRFSNDDFSPAPTSTPRCRVATVALLALALAFAGPALRAEDTKGAEAGSACCAAEKAPAAPKAECADGATCADTTACTDATACTGATADTKTVASCADCTDKDACEAAAPSAPAATTTAATAKDGSCCAPPSRVAAMLGTKVDNDNQTAAAPTAPSAPAAPSTPAAASTADAMACCEMPGADATDATAAAPAADGDTANVVAASIERDDAGLLTITVPSEADGEALATGLGFDVSFENPYDDAPPKKGPYVPSFTAAEISALNTPVAPFALVDQDGAPFTNATLAGRPYIVDFIFTRCSGPCPAMSAQMAKVYRDVRDAGLQVDLVTVSVDPEYDTPEVMKRYASWFGAGEGWHFVTGDYDVIHALANDVLGVGLKKYGGKWDAIQYPGKLMADPIPESILHSQRFILIDDRGIIRGFYEGSEPTDIGRMMRDLELITGTAPAAAPPVAMN